MLDACQVYDYFMANAESQARQKPLQDRKRRQERCTLLAFRNSREAGWNVLMHISEWVPGQGGALHYSIKAAAPDLNCTGIVLWRELFPFSSF